MKCSAKWTYAAFLGMTFLSAIAYSFVIQGKDYVGLFGFAELSISAFALAFLVYEGIRLGRHRNLLLASGLLCLMQAFPAVMSIDLGWITPTIYHTICFILGVCAIAQVMAAKKAET